MRLDFLRSRLASPKLLGELLRVEGRCAAAERQQISIYVILSILIAAAAIYGLALGSFALRPLQSSYSAIKLPVLILGAGLLVLPNFYVLHTALGLSKDFGRALCAILSAQATLAICLAAHAPLVLVLYASSASYRLAVVSNGILWLLAVCAGQVVLRRHYEALIAGNPKHVITRRAWTLLYSLVAIQLAWMLRPFVGNPEQATSFLRDEAWNNAFVIVGRTVWQLLMRL